jgi:hypothetical protein
MKRKKTVIVLIVLSVYMSSYCLLRLSKVLVHQEVALVNKTNASKNGRAICYFIHHDIGRGSFTDDNNYNKINTPGAFARISKCVYHPLVKTEISYYRHTQPREILETVCDQ